MNRLSILFALTATASTQLWSQNFISVAHRTDTAEILDAATLETVATLRFPFGVERLSPALDGHSLNVEGYADKSCCKHYVLDLETMNLRESPRLRQGPDYFGACLTSPDGHWCAQLKTFRGPSLRMADLRNPQTVVELSPPGLPAENSEGNWWATGTWSSDRFFLYVTRPNDPGFFWIVPAGDEALAPRTAVAPFNEVPGCRQRLAVEKGIVAAAGNVFLYESFGGKGDRTSCQTSIPGGAWILDPSTGKLTKQIAPDLHFNRLVAGGEALYGVALDGMNFWNAAVRLIKLDARDGSVLQSRAFGPGVLQIGAGALATRPSGYIPILPVNAARH